jgi:superfamily II DNA or RNA helicase
MYSGMTIPLINFKTKVSERQRYLSDLESGKVKILLASVGVFGEGVNAPNIRALIRAEGGSSEIRTLQAVGRGMRRKPEPNILYLIDFNDTNHPALKKDSKKRFKIYAEEEYEIKKIQSVNEIIF